MIINHQSNQTPSTKPVHEHETKPFLTAADAQAKQNTQPPDQNQKQNENQKKKKNHEPVAIPAAVLPAKGSKTSSASPTTRAWP